MIPYLESFPKKLYCKQKRNLKVRYNKRNIKLSTRKCPSIATGISIYISNNWEQIYISRS